MQIGKNLVVWFNLWGGKTRLFIRDKSNPENPLHLFIELDGVEKLRTEHFDYQKSLANNETHCVTLERTVDGYRFRLVNKLLNNEELLNFEISADDMYILKSKLNWVYEKMLEMELEAAVKEFNRPNLSTEEWEKAERCTMDLDKRLEQYRQAKARYLRTQAVAPRKKNAAEQATVSKDWRHDYDTSKRYSFE